MGEPSLELTRPVMLAEESGRNLCLCYDRVSPTEVGARNLLPLHSDFFLQMGARIGDCVVIRQFAWIEPFESIERALDRIPHEE
jgi:hypothetical protein